MIGALHPTRLRSSSKRVEAKAGDKTVVIYEAILRRAQQMLSERGYYKGASDSKFGPAMEKAIRKFQKDKKIGVTGLPDQRTLLLLFR
jgi:peptidoglycan hydrolase-like protein with peptidoglycan-binding domain